MSPVRKGDQRPDEQRQRTLTLLEQALPKVGNLLPFLPDAGAE